MIVWVMIVLARRAREVFMGMWRSLGVSRTVATAVYNGVTLIREVGSLRWVVGLIVVLVIYRSVFE